MSFNSNNNGNNGQPRKKPGSVTFCTPAFGLFGTMIDLGVDLSPVRERIRQCKLKYHQELWKIICERGMEGDKGGGAKGGGGGGGEGVEEANQSNLLTPQDFGFGHDVNSNAEVGGGRAPSSPPSLTGGPDIGLAVGYETTAMPDTTAAAVLMPLMQQYYQQSLIGAAQTSFIRSRAQLPDCSQPQTQVPSGAGWAPLSDVACAIRGRAADRGFVPLFTGDWDTAARRRVAKKLPGEQRISGTGGGGR